MKFVGTPTKVTVPAKILFYDKLTFMMQNANMLQHPNRSSAAGSGSEFREPANPNCQTEPLARRADGTLDWSVAMNRAQAGDHGAYRQLLKDITPYLRALAVRHLRNGDDIEDTVQDVLLTVHTVRSTYDPSRPFGPWLVAIAHRRIADGLRRRGRVSAHETPLDTEPETFAGADANLQEEAVNARLIKEAIERLSVGQRDAVRMLKLEEMSLEEAAAASGMSVSSLKVATHRAMKRLRELLVPKGSKS